MSVLTRFVVLVLTAHALGDEEAHIVRPCPNFDVDCVRHYFLSSGLCASPAGRVPDPLRDPLKYVYLPNVNGSAIMEDMLVTGMNGDIVEFYINKKKDRAVLAFRIKEFDVESKSAHITYLPAAREPITAATTVTEKNGTVLFTVVFEGTRPLNPRHNFTYARIEVLPILTTGPEPWLSKAMYSGIFANPETTYREGYLTAAPHYSNIFIHYTLCDFGVHHKY
ncbi:Fibrohexamerin [Eumeta japonica]|uniref:Fibrohexamerin n=1 Tax=Eumeta variegata TaxID=151549 RepID=A0A4C1VUR1_EUMVA|nr:Fibrohexamerin [Eumeta japonica]